ncbi:tetratricopeptide repeat protein [Paludibacter sp. 221]|uniref:tetratricopeptide repeat protein n=1 Tax=Paludibacter sp. 221 TaxID=2302939 RepID=UPI0013D82A43|nr:tetratricopeptide repeat protein [Paludibacter sp. 221]NDV46991.1 tetratricopeptide repeat protein [Paludibacter sp. 221]
MIKNKQVAEKNVNVKGSLKRFKGVLIFFFLFQGVCFAQWNTDRIMTIGRNALYFEDYVLAIQYFNQVIAVKPYLAEPYMFRGMAKAQLGDYQGADNDCSEAIARNPFIPQAYYTRGFARRKLGYNKEAVEDFTKALEFSPNSGFLLLNRMDALANLEEYELSLKDLEEYMRTNPKVTELYYEKGRLQLALKDTVGAEQTFNQFVKIDKKNSLAWSARALLHLQKNDLDAALADYNEAIKLKSTFSGDYINRGIVHVQKNNFMQALSDYDTAIKMDSDNTLAYYNRALLRANLGDTNNALDDLKTVIKQDSTYMEARLRKASLEYETGNYRESVNDYKIIINKYPDFIPAYMGIAYAEKALGNNAASQTYAEKGRDIEERLEKERKQGRKKEEIITADNKIEDKGQKGASSRRTEMFNRFTAQNMERAEKESKYSSDTRGTVQDRYTDLVSERNFVLNYYAKNDELRRTNYYHPLIDLYNKEKKLSSLLKITNNEIPLTEDLVKMHFDAVDEISSQLTTETNDADIFFNRATEFALVQDFTNSINDLNKAILLRPDFVLAYFSRANIRYKQIEYTNNAEEDIAAADKERKKANEKQYNFDAEMIMRDYDKVIALAPDFQFAYFNKANVLATLQDYRSAVSYYTRAIDIDAGFAEAYYNRGLVYMFLGEDTKGLADLSKAGELGMYKVYNLIQRFNR